jgi:hypothetical protein
MYFSKDLVRKSFCNLACLDSKGKLGIERTSALMYFLAFSAMKKNNQAMSFDPSYSQGLDNRKTISRQYSKLVTVKNNGSESVDFIQDLGKIEINSPFTPDKKISSNFLTVPLKKASDSDKPQDYPKRPKPLLRLGKVGNVGRWGIEMHPSWQENFHLFLEDRKSKTKYFDLAIVVLRDEEFEGTQSLKEALSELLRKKFSSELSTFWNSKLNWEIKTFKEGTSKWYDKTYPDTFEKFDWLEKKAADHSVKSLSNRILYLENLLRSNNINFK